MECKHPVLRRVPGNQREYVQTPCGICANCRKNFAHMWGTRIYHESRMHTENTFLTLTYSPETLPIGYKGIPTLVKKDVQDFMKRLRIRLDDQKVRFFASGEYGDTTLRPHYHLALFGLSPFDERIFDHHEKQDDGYLCRCKAWNKGLAHVGQVDVGSAYYIGGYALKKVMGKNAEQYYKDVGKIAPFALMSRRPGIGYTYLETYSSEFLKHGNCRVGDFVTGLPRYYRGKLDFNNSDIYQKYLSECDKYNFDERLKDFESVETLQQSIKEYHENVKQSDLQAKYFERLIKNEKI